MLCLCVSMQGLLGVDQDWAIFLTIFPLTQFLIWGKTLWNSMILLVLSNSCAEVWTVIEVRVILSALLETKARGFPP